MPLIAVCYMKARGGSTTSALGVAALLSETARPVVVECDPAGGDLTLRHGLRSASPGLVELATATRTGVAGSPRNGEVLSRYAQPIRLGHRTVEVVPAPSGGAQSRVALSVLARPGHGVLTTPDRTVIADCGRLDFASPTWPLLGLADAVVVLARGRVDELGHLREHVGELVRQVSGRVLVWLVAGGPYRAADVQEYLNRHLSRVLELPADAVQVRELLPYDERTAAVLDGSRKAGRRWRRRPLMRALAQLATELPAASVTSPVAAEAGSRVEVR
jgi:hypothetical protein